MTGGSEWEEGEKVARLWRGGTERVREKVKRKKKEQGDAQ